VEQIRSRGNCATVDYSSCMCRRDVNEGAKCGPYALIGIVEANLGSQWWVEDAVDWSRSSAS
jgi:hypothetical protein